MNVFQVTDAAIQSVLGSYASNLGKNDNDLSGKAVIESASVGNAAAMPYVVGYLVGLTHIANVIADLIPKYWRGKRTMPLRDKNDNQTYQPVNSPGNPYLNYEEKAIKVNIEVQQIIALSNAMPSFSEFMNSAEGLPILIKNLTIYGADSLEEAVIPWLQQKQQQQQQAMQAQQQAMDNSPQMIKAKADAQKSQADSMIKVAELQSKQGQQDFENQIKIAQVTTEKELADAQILEAEARISQAQIDNAVRLEESQTSLEVHSLEAASKLAEIQSRQHHDNLAAQKLEHEISKLEHRSDENG